MISMEEKWKLEQWRKNGYDFIHEEGYMIRVYIQSLGASSA